MNEITPYEYFKEFYQENMGLINTIFFLYLSYPIQSVFLPNYYGKIIQNITMFRENATSEFKYLIGKSIAVLLVSFLMKFYLSKLNTELYIRISNFSREKFVYNVINSYKENYKEQKTGELTSALVKVSPIIKDILFQLNHYIIPLGLNLFFSTIYFMFINSSLGSLLGFLTILGYFIFRKEVEDCKTKNTDLDIKNDTIHENISDIFENLENVYSSGNPDQEINNVKSDNSKYYDVYVKTKDCNISLKYKLVAYYSVCILIIICFALYLYRIKKIDTSHITSIFIVCSFLFSFLNSMSNEINEMIKDMSVLNKTFSLFNMMNKNKEDVNKQQDIKENFSNGDIVFKNIDLVYPGSTNKIFDKFNLTIKQGENVALCGQIGCGKSTLIKLLLKYINFYDGIITINNKNLRNIDNDELRNNITFISQNPKIFNRTLLENILYGCDSNVTEKDVTTLIHKLNLTHIFSNLDNGLHTKLNKRGEKLSGGQKLICSILKAFIKNNNLILLDEPTAALDKNTKKIILDLLSKLSINKTMIIVTHDDDIFTIIDRVIDIK